MRRLSQIAVLGLLMATRLSAQSPHGENLKIDCGSCHSPAGWTNATLIWSEEGSTALKHKGRSRGKDPRVDATAASMVFRHDSTGFALTGAHLTVDCRSCHTTLAFDQAPSDCIACHTDVHASTVGNDCARCHSSTSWIVNEIPELHELNGFALVGSHGNLSCTDCHTSGNPLQFERVGNDCISCHRADFMATRSPNHAASGFSTDCTECHDPMSGGWHTTVVNHDFFPLTLGHAIDDCSRCHTTGSFSDASPGCISCHQQDFASTVNPDHQSAGFSTDCASCHTTNPGWSPTTYDHAVWPLVGGHIPVSCDQCHQGNYQNTPTACEACHLSDYNATTDPNHVTAGFPTDCALCHDEGSWGTATFDHNTTAFPLTGQHTSVDCMQCHANGFTGTPTNCDACHLTDYNGTTSPNHAQSGFPTDCAQCHGTSSWVPAAFDHNSTGFPLTGQHVNASCLDCHANGYAGTPTECEACHMPDYNSASNPNHPGEVYPTDCAFCHTTAGWDPSSFHHDAQYFRIYSGTHNNEWNTCTECHTSPGDYSSFSCIDCHEHDNQNSVNNDHNGVSGYSYSSAACYSCHPNGN